MKIGDLVRLKRKMWRKEQHRKKQHISDLGVVYGLAGKGVKVLMHDSTIRVGLIDHWDVIQESKGNKR
jgi:hypothetical protein